MKQNDFALPELTIPVIPYRADPWVYKHHDGYYYFTATVPEYDRIELRRSKTLAGLSEAPSHVIWIRHPTGIMSSHIWAPEIHFLNGKWYIYFAAGTIDQLWNIHKYVLENCSADPLIGDWVEKGRIITGNSNFTLDATVFELNQKQYLVWAQKPAETPLVSNLYIAELLNPWTIKDTPVLLSAPEYSWEQHLFHVNEGPAVLIRNNRMYITYSASGTDWHYCMGLLHAPVDANPLDPKIWTKSSVPVFQSSEENQVYGPGHNCFTRTEDDSQDVLVYHARDYKDIQGDPLNDPNRHCRMQLFFWDAEGLPIFGQPLKANITSKNPEDYR